MIISRSPLSREITSRTIPSRFLPQFFFDPHTDPGGGAPNENPGNPVTPPNPVTTPVDVDAAVKKRIAEMLGVSTVNNDPMQALSIAVRQNHALEERAKAAEASTLPKADRDFLQAVRATGLNAEQLKTIIAEHSQLSQEKANGVKVQSLKDAAAAEGLNADLLASLDGAMGVEYFTRGEGDAKQGFVKLKDAQGVESEKRLSEWAPTRWPAVAETLKAVAQSGPKGSTKPFTPLGQGAPAGGGTNNNGGQTLIQKRIEARRAANKEKKNPLMT